MKLRYFVLVFTAVILFSMLAQGQTPTEATTIRAMGNATANAIADQIDVVVSINSEADTAQNAVKKSRNEFDRIIAIFRKHLDNDVKFETPDLRASGSAYNNGSNQYVQGQFTVHLTSASDAVATHLMEAVSEANIQQPWIVCKSSQEEKARNEAVKSATVKAKERADAMASALGMKVKRIVSIEDSTPLGGSTGYTNLTMPLGLPTGTLGSVHGKGTGGGTYTGTTSIARPSDGPGSGKGMGVGGPTISTGTNQLNPFGTTGISGGSGSPQEIQVLAVVTIVIEVVK